MPYSLKHNLAALLVAVMVTLHSSTFADSLIAPGAELETISTEFEALPEDMPGTVRICGSRTSKAESSIAIHPRAARLRWLWMRLDGSAPLFIITGSSTYLTMAPAALPGSKGIKKLPYQPPLRIKSEQLNFLSTSPPNQIGTIEFPINNLRNESTLVGRYT